MVVAKQFCAAGQIRASWASKNALVVLARLCRVAAATWCSTTIVAADLSRTIGHTHTLIFDAIEVGRTKATLAATGIVPTLFISALWYTYTFSLIRAYTYIITLSTVAATAIVPALLAKAVGCTPAFAGHADLAQSALRVAAGWVVLFVEALSVLAVVIGTVVFVCTRFDQLVAEPIRVAAFDIQTVTVLLSRFTGARKL